MSPRYDLHHLIYRCVLTSIKNLVRRRIYKLYRVYKVLLEAKIPLYDFQTIDIIKQLPKDAVCIDIGVNEGQILQYLYKHCSKGTIMAIEPIPDLAKVIQSTYSSKIVDIRQLALYDTVGEADFYYFRKRNAVSGLSRRDFASRELKCHTIKVKTIPLDHLFAKDRLDFIKIDVEGAEYNVLKGAYRTLEKYHPVIIFESGHGGLEHFGYSPQDLWDLLVSLGYKLLTLRGYLHKKESFSKQEFIANFIKGYDFQYIAFQ